MISETIVAIAAPIDPNSGTNDKLRTMLNDTKNIVAYMPYEVFPLALKITE